MDRRRKFYARLAAGMFVMLFVLLLTVGLVVIMLYKSGEASLRAAASFQTPQLETDQQAVARIRESYGNTIPWQEDWVVYGDGIYEYNEDMFNFVIMGIDHEGSLESKTDLSDWGAGQADAIFLVALDRKDKQVKIIAIPRNSMVQVDIYNEERQCIDTIYNQICLQYGYAGGGELGLDSMKSCVSELFYGLPIHGACAVSFDAAEIITDMLGGVEVTIPDDMTGMRPDYVQGSRLRLTRENVLSYLRYREYGTLGSPTVRLMRQKEFLRDVVRTGTVRIRQNPGLIRDIYQAIRPYMNTDISLDEAIYLATVSLDYQIGDESFYQLSGEDKQVDFIRKEGTADFYDDLYLDEEALKETVMEVFYKSVTWQEN